MKIMLRQSSKWWWYDYLENQHSLFLSAWTSIVTVGKLETILGKNRTSFEKRFYSVLETLQVLSFSDKNELIGLVIFLCRILKPIKFVSIYESIISIDLELISEST